MRGEDYYSYLFGPELSPAEKAANRKREAKERKKERLSKAAPKLLKALKEAVRMYGQEGGPWNVPSEPGTWISQARAAIKEVEGE